MRANGPIYNSIITLKNAVRRLRELSMTPLAVLWPHKGYNDVSKTMSLMQKVALSPKLAQFCCIKKSRQGGGGGFENPTSVDWEATARGQKYGSEIWF